MQLIMIAAVVAIAISAAGTAVASEELAKSNGCMACHNIEGKKLGPAFKDISAKYRGKTDAESALVVKVSDAKGHPKVKAQGDDVKTLVKWVLSR